MSPHALTLEPLIFGHLALADQSLITIVKSVPWMAQAMVPAFRMLLPATPARCLPSHDPSTWPVQAILPMFLTFFSQLLIVSPDQSLCCGLRRRLTCKPIMHKWRRKRKRSGKRHAHRQEGCPCMRVNTLYCTRVAGRYFCFLCFPLNSFACVLS